jgi:hypothetical protein
MRFFWPTRSSGSSTRNAARISKLQFRASIDASANHSELRVAGCARDGVGAQAFLGCIPLIKCLLLNLSGPAGCCAYETGVRRQ